jgi:uncharacterized protein YggE
MLRIVGLVLASLSVTASAVAIAEDVPRGRLVVIGEGLASAAAEQAKMYVVVTSICYDTARAAKDANAVLANRMLKLLRGFVTTPEDTVTAIGGSLERQSETISVDGEERTICDRKWRTTNTLALLVHKLDTLSDIQASVIAATEAAGDLDPQKKAQTYAEVSRPFFGVKAATDTRLRREAQATAYYDAKAKFNAFASLCPFQDVRLTVIAPPAYAVEEPFGSEMQEQPSSDTETPIIPDEIRVSVEWRFEWSYVAPSTCPR